MTTPAQRAEPAAKMSQYLVTVSFKNIYVIDTSLASSPELYRTAQSGVIHFVEQPPISILRQPLGSIAWIGNSIDAPMQTACLRTICSRGP